MLAGPRNSHGDLEPRGNRFASQANLPATWHPTRLHSGPRTVHPSTQHLSQLLEGTKSFWTSQATSASNDDPRLFQLDALGRFFDDADDLYLDHRRHKLHRDRDHFAPTAGVRGQWTIGLGTH